MRKLLFSIVGIMLAACSFHTQGPPIESGLLSKSAFLVIDIQNDFMNANGKMPVDQRQAKITIKNINKIVSTIDADRLDVIYIGNEFSPTDFIGNLFRNHAAVKGESGAARHPDLVIVNDNYFTKEQPDAFSNRSLDSFLRSRRITHLYIAGVFADKCVLATAKGAVARGYAVSVVFDAIAAKNASDLQNALWEYDQMGIRVVSASRIMTAHK